MRTPPTNARHASRARRRWLLGAALAAPAAHAHAGVYATSLDGCLAAGYAGSKLVVAGDNAGLCRCEGATSAAQVSLDAMWRDQATRDALTSINAFISVEPDFDVTTHDAEGITYTLSSREIAGDRFIDVLHLGVVVGSFGEAHTAESDETTDLGINGSGDPAGGRYHTYDGFLSDERCNADMAHPFGILDFSDIIDFLIDFAAGEPTADIADPPGVYDFSDVVAYLELFGSGCP